MPIVTPIRRHLAPVAANASSRMFSGVSPVTGGDLSAAPDFVSKFYGQATPPETEGFIMQQTMVRITDPEKSLDFYCNLLGMNLIWDVHFPQWGFSIYFVGYRDKSTIPVGPENDLARRALAMNTAGTVELTHNHGDQGPLHTGNTSSSGGVTVKGGFGHIGITVPGDSVYEVCQRFKDMGAEFQKSPNSGGMKGIAFVKDPDGYWVEVIPQGETWKTQDVDCLGVNIDGGGGYAGGGSKAT